MIYTLKLSNSSKCFYRSPNHYARQRTMVVMETVRAATLASSQRKERITAQLANPLAASSPNQRKNKNLGEDAPSIDIHLPSPIMPGDSGLPDEVVRYRNQSYVAPEKLQIVKPLEGSVTLLKWKLLASPQLGGATSFFSDSTRPGVHMKKWKAGGVIDEGRSRLMGTKTKSLSTADISSLETNLSYPLSTELIKAGEGFNTSGVGLYSSMPTSRISNISTSLQSHAVLQNEATASLNGTHSRSILGHFGSFLGSSLSHLGLGTPTKENDCSPENHALSHQGTSDSDAGISAILES